MTDLATLQAATDTTLVAERSFAAAVVNQNATLTSKVVDLTAQVVDLTAQVKALTPVVVKPRMILGVSATPGAFEAGYAAQVKAIGARACYLYGSSVRYSQWDAVPEDQDIWIQTLGTTRSDFDLMLASFPRKRTGRVFLHYHQEPEDNIEDGTLTLAQFQQRTDDLYAAIDAANLPYVVKSVELMYWTLTLNNKGGQGPARTVANFLRPGVQHVGWSAYAEKKVSNGHEIAGTDPAKAAATIKAWADKTGLGFSVITGWSVGSAYLTDAVTLANRVAWTKAMFTAFNAVGSRHLLWFDIMWGSGDYRIETDPTLLVAWRELLAITT